jgi:hypothetical protein
MAGTGPTAERRLRGKDCAKPDIDGAILGTTGFGPVADWQLSDESILKQTSDVEYFVHAEMG